MPAERTGNMQMEMMLDAGAWKGRWFNGKWEVAEQTASVTDKATGEEISRIGLATPADLAASARAASAAQVGWADTAPADRAAIFRRAAALVERHRDRRHDAAGSCARAGCIPRQGRRRVALHMAVGHRCTTRPA
jgi:benzaldehyde dehydrogenase (NAD)